MVFTTMKEQGDHYVLRGTVTGEIYRVASMTGGPDKSDAMNVELEFEAMAYAE